MVMFTMSLMIKHRCLGKESAVFKCVPFQSLKHSGHASCSLIISECETSCLSLNTFAIRPWSYQSWWRDSTLVKHTRVEVVEGPRFLRINPSVLEALFLMVSMCLVHDRSEVMVTPRYLVDFSFGVTSPLMVYAYSRGWRFLVMVRWTRRHMR